MNEDVKRVMSKLMMRMRETEESAPFQTDISIVEKTEDKSSENIELIHTIPSRSRTIKIF